jgi:hypothetical protein
MTRPHDVEMGRHSDYVLRFMNNLDRLMRRVDALSASCRGISVKG